MTYKNKLISLAILLALLLFAAWITLTPREQEMETTASLSPDALMEDVVAIIMDKQGKPSMKIVTSKMLHYKQHDISHFTNPEVTIFRKSMQPWFISSKFAKATRGLDQIDFNDDVTIHHAADLSNPATVIKTLSLSVHPHAETAETQSTIQLSQPNLTVEATGMLANITTGNIKLLSDARGEYVPSAS